MSTGRLFISLWRICLENLPEGVFARRCITPDEARLSIERAREGGTLLCLADDDLLAPYHERERKNHEALCLVLTERFGIGLSLRDFVGKSGDDEELYSVNALNCAQVRGHDRLMVVTCLYTSGEKALDGLPEFGIDPQTAEFHIIETQ